MSGQAVIACADDGAAQAVVQPAALVVRVVVLFLQVGLVHVRVGVLGSFGVGVRVFMFDMFMLVAGVRMRVRDLVVAVFVGVRVVMTIWMCHCHLPVVAGSDESIVLSTMGRWDRVGACSSRLPRCRTVLMGPAPLALRTREL